MFKITVRRKVDWGKSQVMWLMMYKFLRLDAFCEEGGRRSRYIGEVLERYRGEDAGDLKRIELVETWRCLKILEKEMSKSNPEILTEEKSWRTWKSIQNIVMDEEFLKNFVMGAKIGPKVEMGLSMFEIGVWKILQLSNRKLFEEFEEAVLQLIGILSRDSSLVMRYVGTSTREGLREMVQCYRRQHFAASSDLHEHQRGHSSWRESTRMKFMNIQKEYSKMRSEQSEDMWKTRVILIHLESYFGTYAQEVWERNWMDPDMQTILLDTELLKAKLLNMYNPILMETVLKKLREQYTMDDQMKTAGEITGSVPETSLN